LNKIYTYYDYQNFLNDFYQEKKSDNPFFSYRYISRKVGIDHGLVVKIVQGKRHISRKSIPAFAALCELSRRETEYFELLVLYGKAKTDREIKHYFEKLLACAGTSSKKVEADKYEFYQKWYYTAVREIINLCTFTGDFGRLAKTVEPSISPAEAKKAVRLLERLGFIRRDEQGIYRQTSAFITTGENWKSIAILSFQKEAALLGARALDDVAKEERDISTVTITLDESKFDMLRERIRAFQQELIDISACCGNVNKVYQVNLQVFPLSKKIEPDSFGGRHA
jgi:uncharacterized protein (TIGR02147 family)